jgi:hypothetical protein
MADRKIRSPFEKVGDLEVHPVGLGLYLLSQHADALASTDDPCCISGLFRLWFEPCFLV